LSIDLDDIKHQTLLSNIARCIDCKNRKYLYKSMFKGCIHHTLKELITLIDKLVYAENILGSSLRE